LDAAVMNVEAQQHLAELEIVEHKKTSLGVITER